MIMLVCVCNIDIYGGLKCKKVKNKEKHQEEKSPDLIPRNPQIMYKGQLCKAGLPLIIL